ncbi:MULTISPECIES: GNAT family N-acetyltransferase [unclassified Pseudofrankia]|uniref:GNAT family N-acetyltransferase n=1 Tax=unclassified Pseudofrankia TaxID=2994372 RepID=UPI0008DA6186|nr:MULTISPECIES: GNAT family N-acetyltransferase [unclassified Pseudofrankia]MDT3444625.1 GNAT family N-acetyltransferase [Pseudofrankia sp. BMG5.37]OHV47476.1 acetyltransferase [Pseudofrankia sp. BMG5.36]
MTSPGAAFPSPAFPGPALGPLRPSYPVETERLLLRPIDPVGDVDGMHAYRSRADVCRYIPPEPMDRAQIAERLANPDFSRAELDREGQALTLAVVLKETGELIGDVVIFWRSTEHRGGEIGYVINPDHHGNGYATEAARALLALLFDEFRLHRVTARIDAENPASAAVLTKLGMRREAVLVENEWFKGRWSTEIDFAILDREWRALRGQDG